MSDTILSGDMTIYYTAENKQKRLAWTGSATGTRTTNEVYSALQTLFDDPSQMDDPVPMKADTPDIYRLQNQWFIDDNSVEHLTGGSLFTEKWKDGTTEYILTISYAQTTEFNAVDIGKTIKGSTTGDTGTLLDFNTGRKLIWIRPDVATVGGDEFDNGSESYVIDDMTAGEAWVNVESTPVNDTIDFNDAGADDVTPFTNGNTGDQFVVGHAQKFSKVKINVGTAGTGTTTLVWKYWNGAWTNLAVVSDGTTSFKTTGTNSITFTIPTDWTARSISGGATLYYILAEVATANYTVDPILTQGWITGVGAGAFANHNRHGVGSVAGESGWTGITTIGTIEPFTHVYIGRED